MHPPVKMKNTNEHENGPAMKQSKLFDFTESRTKYESSSKNQQDFDDAMLAFFAMTFSPLQITNI